MRILSYKQYGFVLGAVLLLALGGCWGGDDPETADPEQAVVPDESGPDAGASSAVADSAGSPVPEGVETDRRPEAAVEATAAAALAAGAPSMPDPTGAAAEPGSDAPPSVTAETGPDIPPTVEPSPAAADAPPSVRRFTGRPGEREHCLVCGSFRALANAQGQVRELAEHDLFAEIEAVVVQDVVYHRVRICGLADVAGAEMLGEDLRRRLGIRYWILTR